MKDYSILDELVPKTQELHRAIFDKGYEQGQKDILEQLSYDDFISRQAVLNTLDKMDKALDTDRTVESYKELLTECYKDLPPAVPNEKTGKWIEGGYEDRYYVCSKCNYEASEYWHKPSYKYCPNCGVKMIESQERNDNK